MEATFIITIAVLILLTYFLSLVSERYNLYRCYKEYAGYTDEAILLEAIKDELKFQVYSENGVLMPVIIILLALLIFGRQ